MGFSTSCACLYVYAVSVSVYSICFAWVMTSTMTLWHITLKCENSHISNRTHILLSVMLIDLCNRILCWRYFLHCYCVYKNEWGFSCTSTSYDLLGTIAISLSLFLFFIIPLVELITFRNYPDLFYVVVVWIIHDNFVKAFTTVGSGVWTGATKAKKNKINYQITIKSF